MNKLMLAIMAVAFGMSANAATLKWGSGTVKLADSMTTADKGTVSACLFLVDAVTYATYAAYTSGKELSDAVYAAYGSSPASATASTTKKGIATITDPTTYSNGSTAYGIILYTEGDNYMGNIATYSFTSDLDATIGDLSTRIGGDVGDGSTATAWSTAAIPEPTSGLLLLLGMAGLALKRKRA